MSVWNYNLPQEDYEQLQKHPMFFQNNLNIWNYGTDPTDPTDYLVEINRGSFVNLWHTNDSHSMGVCCLMMFHDITADYHRVSRLF